MQGQASSIMKQLQCAPHIPYQLLVEYTILNLKLYPKAKMATWALDWQHNSFVWIVCLVSNVDHVVAFWQFTRFNICRVQVYLFMKFIKCLMVLPFLLRILQLEFKWIAGGTTYFILYQNVIMIINNLNISHVLIFLCVT